MSHPGSSVSPTAAIAQRVQLLRKRRGWSAAKLGVELSRHGVPWDRFAVTSLENGKRQNVTVQELLALALVFEVAPVNLLVPTGSAVYQVAAPGSGEDGETPARVESASAVRAWVTGRKPLPGTDERTYFGEAPETDREPAVAAVRSLHNDVEAAAARADSFRLPDTFPGLMAVARSSLERVRAEVDVLALRQERVRAAMASSGEDDMPPQD